ncbi:hypothetical protein DH2020_032382 [Rehmannia glutinosa]|uniref:Protein argonaute 7 n=1 Tax=Rehmannia glutinosa TaxID=99300 RepID=A0ABR0VFC3_REHGL
MEEEEESNTSRKKFTPKTRNFRGTQSVNSYQYHHHLLQNYYGFNYTNQFQTFPPLLPLPPSIPLQLTLSPSFHQNQRLGSTTHFQKASRKQNNSLLATSSDSKFQDFSFAQEVEKEIFLPCDKKNGTETVDAKPKSLAVAKRPDSGGVEGKPIALVANHFLVEFDPSQKIFHYDVEIFPNPSKEVARMIKRKLVGENSTVLSGARPEYIHALDVVLRESPAEKCFSVGRSFYSSSFGGAKEIGGGAIALKGFFQSLRPTQQGLSLNVDFSVTAFHESIGVIPYLQKRLDFMHDISREKTRILTSEEKKEVEKALKNLRIFVCHRETVQRYRVYSLTGEITENLSFPDRDGRNLRLVSYFKDHYEYDVQYTNLPCLQISRRKPCYLPMELCVICEGQKFLGKLSDDQTVKLLKMGCQKPRERKKIIDSVMEGQFGPTSGDQGKDFKLRVSKEMTRLTGRILQPPKLKLGNGGHVRNLTPFRHDRQWNLLDSHVFEGTRIERWAIISFGGTPDQKSSIQKFINQLSQRCEQLGIFLHKNTVISPLFEPMHVLGNAKLLESKLRKIHKAAFGNLQLLVCVMERKHRGYADLKRIAETSIGIVSQCCLYSNLGKLGSQFLANLALKINAKVGGCTVALYNSLPSEIPRIFRQDDPVIFMGADVTHPHPLDDFSPSVAAVVGSVNWPAANKYVSRMRSQTHRQEIIQDLCAMLAKRNSIKCCKMKCNKFARRVQDFRAINAITFAVVQKRHHTRLFPKPDPSLSENQFLDKNIPPGTVVDTAITHPTEFDFYLCSHWGIKGTSRPVHYHVLWDDNEFTSDEVQKLVYNLCYTFVRCTKPVSLVPPVYYAHLAAYRGRLYLDRSIQEVARFRVFITRGNRFT